MKPLFRTAALAATFALTATAHAGQIEPRLQRLVSMPVAAAQVAKLNRTGLYSLKVRGGQVFVSVILEARPTAIPALRNMGARVHSVLSSGIVTADVPVNQLQALAARADIGKVEGARRVHKYNTEANGLTTVGNATVGMNNPRTSTGAGVVVGVLDSGLDWTHGDFINDTTGDSRIRAYWDQSDHDDDNVPAGFTYGHEYTQADFNTAIKSFNNTWTLDTVSNTSSGSAVDDPSYPIKASARDTDGHGTHVTGSAAGDGSASGERGVAYEADIVFVKFDFEGDRNSDAAIIDGINYIFQKAAALGKPCVINMSLGSDFGPHDGSTLEERGIDELTGPGKVVCVAAGNPGANNWSAPLSWGFAMHGSGTMDSDTVTFRFPAAYDTSHPDGSYVFFDIWYSGATKCRVQIKSPSGQLYPSNFNGPNRRTWKTGSPGSGYNTPEGGLIVYNGGDQLGWDTTNGDNELYVEIGDYYGTAPVGGTWEVRIIKESGSDGSYHSWHGTSANVVRGWRAEPQPRDPTPRFGGRESDNISTIGSPASASKVLAVAAYQSRQTWTFYDAILDAAASGTMSYGQAPITYYDPYAMGELANFSGRGPRRDGVLKPEIAAPGVGISSSFSHFTRHLEWPDRAIPYGSGSTYHFATNRVRPNLEATVIQGTSMACPNATGGIALLLEADPTLDDAGLRSLFQTAARHDLLTDTYANTVNSAETDTDASAAPNSANNDWGYGKLDIALGLQVLSTPTPNNAPVAQNGSTSTPQDTPASITLQASDADGDSLSYSYTQPANGVVTGSGPDVTYTPNPGYAGTDSFTFAANDGQAASNTATISITVTTAPPAGSTPSIASLSPDNGDPNTTLTVRITGANFEPGASADFGNRIAVQSVTYVSDTALDVSIKIHRRASSGARSVTVTTSGGTSGAAVFTVN